MTTCRSCGAEIDWIKTKSGKLIPRNREFKILRSGESAMAVLDDGTIEKTTHPEGFGGYTGVHESHFATCPEADKWRKEKRNEAD